jgi:hypothetical protein
MIGMKKPISIDILRSLTLVWLSMLACRPVLTIGWQEVGILVLLLLVLIGPVLFRLYKRFDEFQQWKTKKGENKTED